MFNSPRVRLMVMVGVILTFGLVGGVALTSANGSAPATDAPAAAAPAVPAAASQYSVLGWNDLGMHCYNADFSDLAVLPPFNTLWVQVVQRGDPPLVVTKGITVEYSFPDNTTSVTKSNFWTYAKQLFGVALPPDIGLKGKGLSGHMDLNGDHFEAVGIPLTEYRDSDTVNRYPFQLAQIIVRDSATNAELGRQTVVAPVSTEMTCNECHSDTGDATTAYPITPTGSVTKNILTLHDYLSQANYPAGHQGALMSRRPVLCAECHGSNALGAPGVAGVESLSNAMHKHHQSLPDIVNAPNPTDGCYKCHPGPTTQCLRDVMSQEENMNCTNCHGTISKVAQNANPWFNEPRCDNANCHGTLAKQTQPLYRFSIGHGGIYCEACHDSTHAIATSREANDAIKFINLQGHSGTLNECTVCHLSTPPNRFLHTAMMKRNYLPVMNYHP